MAAFRKKVGFAGLFYRKTDFRQIRGVSLIEHFVIMPHLVIRLRAVPA
jgi:hypothetical protein